MSPWSCAMPAGVFSVTIFFSAAPASRYQRLEAPTPAAELERRSRHESGRALEAILRDLQARQCPSRLSRSIPARTSRRIGSDLLRAALRPRRRLKRPAGIRARAGWQDPACAQPAGSLAACRAVSRQPGLEPCRDGRRRHENPPGRGGAQRGAGCELMC
jgi:hypothetical protein